MIDVDTTEVSGYARKSVVLHLGRPDQFRHTTPRVYRNDKEFDFLVTRVSYDGDDDVTLRGPGIKKNGETASVNRQCSMDLTEFATRFPALVVKILIEMADL